MTAVATSRGGPPPGQGKGALSTFAGLVERDLRVMRREIVTVLARSVMQPLLFLVIFGYVLPRIGTVRGNEFGPILFPGILSMSTILSGMQAVTLPIAIDLGFVREIDDRLLCPIRIEWIGLEKILFGAFQASVSAAVIFPLAVLVMGDIVDVDLARVPFLALMIVAASLMATCLGLFIGTLVQPRQLPLVFSVIVTPLIFFGCNQYTWRSLGPHLRWVQVAVLVNPLTYASEGMRAVLTPDIPGGVMPVWGIVVGTVLAAGTFGTIGVRRFRSRALQ